MGLSDLPCQTAFPQSGFLVAALLAAGSEHLVMRGFLDAFRNEPFYVLLAIGAFHGRRLMTGASERFTGVMREKACAFDIVASRRRERVAAQFGTSFGEIGVDGSRASVDLGDLLRAPLKIVRTQGTGAEAVDEHFSSGVVFHDSEEAKG